jgi:hypothetical protein
MLTPEQVTETFEANAKYDRCTFLVSADHVSPNYRFERHEVRVSRDRYEGKFYADAGRLGCGKLYSTPHKAITGLFGDHACTFIRVESAAQ